LPRSLAAPVRGRRLSYRQPGDIIIVECAVEIRETARNGASSPNEAITMRPRAEAGMAHGFAIRPAGNADIAAIRAVLFSVRSEYGVLGENGANDADLDDIELHYFGRGGCFEVVEDAAKRVVGCAGLYPLNPCRAELCKMYIEKAARGRGLGKRLLEDLLGAARRGGFREVWLETNSVLTAAIALYRHYGFEPVESDGLLPRCDAAYLLRIAPRP